MYRLRKLLTFPKWAEEHATHGESCTTAQIRPSPIDGIGMKAPFEEELEYYIDMQRNHDS
jgi:hypothetical protein